MSGEEKKLPVERVNFAALVESGKAGERQADFPEDIITATRVDPATVMAEIMQQDRDIESYTKALKLSRNTAEKMARMGQEALEIIRSR